MTGPIPSVECGEINPVLQVRDVAVAADYYRDRLGFTIDFTWEDPPSYAGVRLDRVQLHLMRSESAAGGRGVNFVVDDVDALNRLHADNGVEISGPPEDMPWGLRSYHARDLDGNWLGFGQHIFTLGEKIPVQRVELAIRLERRMAAVLEDLAGIKRMTIGEVLEETLCHTWEPLPDGESVPSPHTRRQLEQIRELKARHGIDYDSHGSYRFTEILAP